MSKARQPPRVVVDTNLVLSALVFGTGTPGALRHAWQQARFQPLVSNPTAAELLRALASPKFKLSPAKQEELLADYLPWCETVTIPEPPPAIPSCRDLSDQPFLHLAVAGTADFLVTGDADLLSLAGKFSCPITTAAGFLGSWKNKDEQRRLRYPADTGRGRRLELSVLHRGP